jgi:hypothetical protein
MQFLMTLYVAALFFVLTPGILVSLPPGGKKMTVALVHAVVFAVVYQLTHKMVLRALYEGFEAPMTTCTAATSSMCGAGKSCKDAAGAPVSGSTTGVCS